MWSSADDVVGTGRLQLVVVACGCHLGCAGPVLMMWWGQVGCSWWWWPVVATLCSGD